MKTKYYNYRYLAKVMIEAETPIAVGSGVDSIFTSACVVKDANGLPYIPGTVLAGVIRHLWENNIENKNENIIFGSARSDDENNDIKGSLIIFSSANLVYVDKNKVYKVVEGLLESDDYESDFFKRFKYLPVRQHVKIGANGAAEDKGKFDNEIVYKGTRFCFEIEMISDEDRKLEFDKVLSILSSSFLRLGSGTRSGLGAIKTIRIKRVDFDLFDESDRNGYLDISASLNDKFWSDDSDNSENKKELKKCWADFLFKSGSEDFLKEGWTNFQLELEPEDFFIFGSGFESESANNTPVEEVNIRWKNDVPEFIDNFLIPASSIKGAMAHRVAFYYNKESEIFLDVNILDYNKNVGVENIAVSTLLDNNILDYNEKVGVNNLAVSTLFGKDGECGNVIINDIFCEYKNDENINRHVQTHVKIDAFTGKTVDGALFSDELVYKTDLINERIKISILVKKSALEDEKIIKAFDLTLRDLENGYLPLGGLTNKGNGTFKSVK